MVFWSLIQQDIRLAWRHGRLAVMLGFFLLGVSLLPFAIGADFVLLRTLAAGLLWIIFLLTILLGLEYLFQEDWADGTFEQLLLSPYALEQIIAAKLIGYFAAFTFPLLLAVPLGGLLLNLPFTAIIVLMTALSLAAPALICFGAIAAAFSVAYQRTSLLSALLIMPFYIPLLIFGSGASKISLLNGGAPLANYAILASFSLTLLILAPFLISAILRQGLR